MTTAIAKQDDTEDLLEMCKGDRNAVMLIEMLMRISQTWDDLIDEEAKPSALDINNAFLFALSTIPRNPFYRRYMDELVPLLDSAILSWLGSNELVKGDHEMKVIAHVARFQLVTVVIKIVQLIGGYDWAIRWTERLWGMGCRDTLDHFLSEQKNA